MEFHSTRQKAELAIDDAILFQHTKQLSSAEFEGRYPGTNFQSVFHTRAAI